MAHEALWLVEGAIPTMPMMKRRAHRTVEP